MQSGQPAELTDLEQFQQLITYLTFPEKKLFFNTDKRQTAFNILMESGVWPADIDATAPVFAQLSTLATEIKILKNKLAERNINLLGARIELYFAIQEVITSLSSTVEYNSLASETINNLNNFFDKNLAFTLDNKQISLYFINQIESEDSLASNKEDLLKLTKLFKEICSLSDLFDLKSITLYLCQLVYNACVEIKRKSLSLSHDELRDIKNKFIKNCRSIVSNLSFFRGGNSNLCEQDLIKFCNTKKLLKEILNNNLDNVREYENLCENIKASLSSVKDGKAGRYFSGDLQEDNPKAKALRALGEKFNNYHLLLVNKQKTLLEAYQETLKLEEFENAIKACRDKSWFGFSDVAGILEEHKNIITQNIRAENYLNREIPFEKFILEHENEAIIIETNALMRQIITFSQMTDASNNILNAVFLNYNTLSNQIAGIDINAINIFRSCLIHACRDLVVRSNKNPNNKELTDEAFFKEKSKILAEFESQYNCFLITTELLAIGDKYTRYLTQGFNKISPIPEDKKSNLIYQLGVNIRSISDKFSSKTITLDGGVSELHLLMISTANNIRELPSGKNSNTALEIQVFAEEVKKMTSAKRMQDMQVELKYRLDPTNNIYLDTPLSFVSEKQDPKEESLFLNQHLKDFDNVIRQLVLPRKSGALFNKRQCLLKLGTRSDDTTIFPIDSKDKEIFELGQRIKSLRTQLENDEITFFSAKQMLRIKINSVMKVSREKSNLGKSDTADYLDKFVKTHINTTDNSLMFFKRLSDDSGTKEKKAPIALSEFKQDGQRF